MDPFAPLAQPIGVVPLAPPPFMGGLPPAAPPPPPDLATLRSQLDTQEQRILNNWYTQYRQCIFCKKTYLEIDNLGQWKCGQHVSGVVDTRDFCKPAVVTHLVRADHRWMFNPVRWSSMDDQVLSQSLVTYLQRGQHLNPQSIIKTTKGKNCVGISRFDRRATDSMLEACSEWSSPLVSYEKHFPYSVEFGPMEARRVRPYLALHDQLYRADTADAVIRRTPVCSFRRTVGSVSDSDRVAMRRLQIQRVREMRERTRQVQQQGVAQPPP